MTTIQLPDAPTTHIRLQQLPRCIHGVSPACQWCREGHEQMMRSLREISGGKGHATEMPHA